MTNSEIYLNALRGNKTEDVIYSAMDAAREDEAGKLIKSLRDNGFITPVTSCTNDEILRIIKAKNTFERFKTETQTP